MTIETLERTTDDRGKSPRTEHARQNTSTDPEHITICRHFSQAC